MIKQTSVLAVLTLCVCLGTASYSLAAATPPTATVIKPATSVAAHTEAAPAPASSASAVVKYFYDKLQDTMQHGEQLGYAGRYKKLDPVVRSSFNLSTMTRFAVGTVWSKATPEEQQALISAFSDFTVANYAHQFSASSGEEFVVLDEKPVSGGVLVETTLKPKDKDAIPLNYLMRPDDKGVYRIVDIFLNGSISQLAARRSEFNAIAERDGIPALVSTLGEKSKQMGPT